MARVLKGDDEEPIAIIDADPVTRTVTVHIPSPDPVCMSPDQIDRLRNILGLAAGEAREGNPHA